MAEIKKYTDEYELYLRDESRSTGYADYICFAKSEDDIKEAIKFCYDNNMRLTVQGGSTGLAAGAVPYGGLVLNLSRMKRFISEREEGGRLFMTYEPGILLSELREDLAKRHPDYFFAPDPTETGASLGGMLACNASGACSFMYGATRNHINGLKIYFTDGRCVTLRRGQQFAKGLSAELKCDDGSVISCTLPSYTMPNTKTHVAGYYVKPDMDLIDLFIGSDG
ncbi:MAG: FAD-binding oxidoreductase, partial [Firmicutes bacterium]|nr:FAD-binding oxidoreductase [Bacillota bacterium]